MRGNWVVLVAFVVENDNMVGMGMKIKTKLIHNYCILLSHCMIIMVINHQWQNAFRLFEEDGLVNCKAAGAKAYAGDTGRCDASFLN